LDEKTSQSARTYRKPQWVRHTVIRLAVHDLSCRRITHHFNRRFGPHITIGKSWVNMVLRAHALEIVDLRRAMRRSSPIPFAVNHTWAMDLSFYASPTGALHTVLGIIDHGSHRWKSGRTKHWLRFSKHRPRNRGNG